MLVEIKIQRKRSSQCSVLQCVDAWLQRVVKKMLCIYIYKYIYTHEEAVSWNIKPHGYKGSQEAVRQIFEQGPPIICLQDVRIPKRGKRNLKRELQRIFPHYCICITTAKSSRTNSRDRPHVFSVLTALNSAFLPKVTQVPCRH